MRMSQKLFCVLVLGVPEEISTLSVSHTKILRSESNHVTQMICICCILMQAMLYEKDAPKLSTSFATPRAPPDSQAFFRVSTTRPCRLLVWMPPKRILRGNAVSQYEQFGGVVEQHPMTRRVCLSCLLAFALGLSSFLAHVLHVLQCTWALQWGQGMPLVSAVSVEVFSPRSFRPSRTTLFRCPLHTCRVTSFLCQHQIENLRCPSAVLSSTRLPLT